MPGLYRITREFTGSLYTYTVVRWDGADRYELGAATAKRPDLALSLALIRARAARLESEV